MNAEIDICGATGKTRTTHSHQTREMKGAIERKLRLFGGWESKRERRGQSARYYYTLAVAKPFEYIFTVSIKRSRSELVSQLGTIIPGCKRQHPLLENWKRRKSRLETEQRSTVHTLWSSSLFEYVPHLGKLMFASGFLLLIPPPYIHFLDRLIFARLFFFFFFCWPFSSSSLILIVWDWVCNDVYSRSMSNMRFYSGARVFVRICVGIHARQELIISPKK